MAKNRKRRYLLCYDIADPRRLGRLHRHISRKALFVQYSVYLYHGTEAELLALLDELRQRIEAREDDIRAYPLPGNLHLETEGQNLADEAIFLLGDAVAGFV